MKLEREGYNKMITVKFEDFALQEKGFLNWYDTLNGKDGILLIYLLFLSNLIIDIMEL